MSLLPALYTPKSPYTSDTNVLIPPIVSALRAGAVFMLEWVSLRFVDNAPIVVWIATALCAVGVLAVLQTKEWLDFKGKWYFTISLAGLLAVWVAISAYGYWAHPPQDKIIPTFPTAEQIAAAIARNFPPQNTPPTPRPVTRGATTEISSPFLHLTDAKRWRLMTQLHDSLINQIPSDQRCHAILASKPVNSAGLFWTDFSPILNYANWILEGGANRTAFPEGITIEVAGDKGTGFTCGWKLSELLESTNAGPVNFRANQTTPNLLRCPECTEIVIGDVTVH